MPAAPQAASVAERRGGTSELGGQSVTGTTVCAAWATGTGDFAGQVPERGACVAVSARPQSMALQGETASEKRRETTLRWLRRPIPDR
jgi:hypothetical protein